MNEKRVADMSDAEVEVAQKDWDKRVAELQRRAAEMGLSIHGLPAPGVLEDGISLKEPSPYLARGERPSGLTVEEEEWNRVARIASFRKGAVAREAAKAQYDRDEAARVEADRIAKGGKPETEAERLARVAKSTHVETEAEKQARLAKASHPETEAEKQARLNREQAERDRLARERGDIR